MRGNRLFEGKNHLGYVLVVFSDRKIPEEDNGQIAYYTADVVSYNDFWPYGWVLNGRHGGESYSFSFQEQEGDDEIKGENNSINYKYRMHDTRIGRFFAVDPLAPKYPHNSPYAFSENRVLDGIELEGLEFEPINNNQGEMVDAKYVGYDWSSGSPVAPEGTLNNFSIGNTIYSSGASAPLYNESTGQATGRLEMWSITTTIGTVQSSIGSSGNLKYSKTSYASAMYGAEARETVSGIAEFKGEKSLAGKTRALYSELGLEFMNQVDAASQERAQQMAAYRADMMTGRAQAVYPELMLLGGGAGGITRSFAANFILGAGVDASVQYAGTGSIGDVDWVSSLSSGVMSSFTKRPFLSITTASLINASANYTLNYGLETVFDKTKSRGAFTSDLGFGYLGGYGGRVFNSYPTGWSHFGNSVISGGTIGLNLGINNGLGL